MAQKAFAFKESDAALKRMFREGLVDHNSDKRVLEILEGIKKGPAFRDVSDVVGKMIDGHNLHFYALLDALDLELPAKRRIQFMGQDTLINHVRNLSSEVRATQLGELAKLERINSKEYSEFKKKVLDELGPEAKSVKRDFNAFVFRAGIRANLIMRKGPGAVEEWRKSHPQPKALLKVLDKYKRGK